MSGMKTYLGALVKGIAGAAGTVIIATLPSVAATGSTKSIAVVGVLYWVGNALKEIGQRHAVEKQTEAIKAQTEAMK